MYDLISRQETIDEWKNDFKGYVNALNIPRDDYNGIMAYIDELPPAQPEQRWIPCSERLPEGSPAWRTEYLATVYCAQWKEKTKTMCVDWENATVRGKAISRWTWNNRLFPKEWEVIAWMPLPKKYSGE